MTIKLEIRIAIILIILGLAVALFFSISKTQKQNQKIKVLMENNEKLAQAEQSYTIRLIKAQQNTKSLEKMFQNQTRILDSLKTKWKNVPQLTTVYIANTDTIVDTVRITQIIPMMPNIEMQKWDIKEGCFELSGKSYFDFVIEQKKYIDTMYIVIVSGERRHLFGWKCMPQWGRKNQDTIRTWSNCGDIKAVVIEKIEN